MTIKCLKHFRARLRCVNDESCTGVLIKSIREYVSREFLACAAHLVWRFPSKTGWRYNPTLLCDRNHTFTS